jgi:hypothetical protein
MGAVVEQQGEEELRQILWAAWDPIGGVPRDEYETYAPQIASRLRAGATPLTVRHECNSNRVMPTPWPGPRLRQRAGRHPEWAVRSHSRNRDGENAIPAAPLAQ